MDLRADPDFLDRSTPILLFNMRTYRTNWRPLLLAAGLLGGLAVSAQVIQVPSNCTVVIPGTGGSVMNHWVGNGGVITMPDPYAGGDFTFVNGSPRNWTLLGDISLPTSTTSNAADQTAGALPTVNIRSYNKQLRTYENRSSITAMQGRSKGHVEVEYDNGQCGGLVEFDVYKQFSSYLPPIQGPNCFPAPLENMTFSVDQMVSDNANDAIGFDQYYWTLRNSFGDNLLLPQNTGIVAYTSADRSSITIHPQDASFAAWYGNGYNGPYILHCFYGRANPWDGGASNSDLNAQNTNSNEVVKVIGAMPTAPTFVPAIATCLAADQTSYTITYNVVPGNTYTWTCPIPGWSLAQSPGNLAITNMDGRPVQLTLTVRNACGTSADYSYYITRALYPLGVALSSSCVAAGSTFTVTAPNSVPGSMLCFIGTASGWPHTEDPVTHVWTFTVPPGTCAGAYQLLPGIQGLQETCPSCARPSYTIRVKPAVPVLSGPACVPANSGPAVTYTSTTPCGANSYIWNNTLGMTPGPTVTTSGPSVNYTPTGTVPGDVTVTAQYILDAVPSHNCASDPSAPIHVDRGPVAPVLNALPCVNVGLSGTAVFSVQDQSGVTFTWNFPPAFGTPAQTTGTSVTVNTEGVPGTYTFSVTASTGGSCGPATTTSTITVGPLGYSIDSVETANSTTIFVNLVPNTQYQVWDCIGDSALNDYSYGGYTQNLTGSGSGSYAFNCDPDPVGGCIQRTDCITTTHTYRSLMVNDGQQGDQEHQSLTGNIRVVPNPNNGFFTLQVDRDFTLGSVTLLDGAGRQVSTRTRLVRGANEMRYHDLVPGTYVVRIELDGHVETRSIVIAER